MKFNISISNVDKEYDLGIIGGGPAGLTAAIYASRYKVKPIVFTDLLGGLVTENHLIENYPGFIKISGQELADKMVKHAKETGATVVNELVTKVEKIKDGFKLYTTAGREIKVKAIIIASGLERRKLNVKNEDKFYGKGVSYCATCDAPFYKGKITAVVGGGNSAAVAALLLAEYSEKVYIIYRRDKFYKMEAVYIDRIMNNPKIEPIFNEEVVELIGSDKLEKIKLKSGKELKVDGIFVEIGFTPRIPFEINVDIERDKKGFIKVDAAQRTNVKGIFAAGDITTNSNYFQQIITAAAEGAIAADSAYKYILGGE